MTAISHNKSLATTAPMAPTGKARMESKIIRLSVRKSPGSWVVPFCPVILLWSPLAPGFFGRKQHQHITSYCDIFKTVFLDASGFDLTQRPDRMEWHAWQRSPKGSTRRWPRFATG